jgi:hypothetical protein
MIPPTLLRIIFIYIYVVSHACTEVTTGVVDWPAYVSQACLPFKMSGPRLSPLTLAHLHIPATSRQRLVFCL